MLVVVTVPHMLPCSCCTKILKNHSKERRGKFKVIAFYVGLCGFDPRATPGFRRNLISRNDPPTESHHTYQCSSNVLPLTFRTTPRPQLSIAKRKKKANSNDGTACSMSGSCKINRFVQGSHQPIGREPRSSNRKTRAASSISNNCTSCFCRCRARRSRCSLARGKKRCDMSAGLSSP